MEEIYLSAAEVGKCVNTSFRNIQNWADNGHVTKNNNKYGLISAFKHQNSQLKQQLETHKSKFDTAELKLRKLQAETDKEIAIARIRKLEADKMEGILVDAEQVGAAWKGYVLRCRAKLLSLPNKLALELSGIDNEAEIEQILQKTIDEALAELTVNEK